MAVDVETTTELGTRILMLKRGGGLSRCMARLFDAHDLLEDKLREAGDVVLKLREELK